MSENTVTEIVLAEFGGNHWVVAGEEHLGDLLANVLAEGIGVRFVACAGPDEPRQLWLEGGERDPATEAPWMINPAIIRRIKGAAGHRAIGFSPWSAMLDADADQVVRAAAEWLRGHAPARIAVRQFALTTMPPGMTDLQRLRGQLVVMAFTRAGADATAVDIETADAAEPADIDRMELVTQTPTSG